MNEEQDVCHISSNETCCETTLDNDCCTTSEIKQDGTFYDFVVNQTYKVTAPVTLISNIHFYNTIELLESRISYHITKPPPLPINNQAVFQVFLC